MMIKLLININTNDILLFSSYFSKLYHHLGLKNFSKLISLRMDFSELIGIVAVSAEVSVLGNFTRSTFILVRNYRKDEFEPHATGHVVLSH